MRAGRLDRLIDIQRNTPAQSGSGAPVEAWTTIVARRAASIKPVKGDERLSGPEIAATDQVEFRIRYSSNVADLTPRDRVVYPARNDDSPEPDGWRIYDILQLNPIGRGEGWQIIAQRRPDLTS